MWINSILISQQAFDEAESPSPQPLLGKAIIEKEEEGRQQVD
jgi:hypothetical protein